MRRGHPPSADLATPHRWQHWLMLCNGSTNGDSITFSKMPIFFIPIFQIISHFNWNIFLII